MIYSRIKRFADVLFALVAATVTLPIMMILAVSVFLHFRESPFFTQERSGQHGRVFRIIKFKTMMSPGSAGTTDGQRSTNFGRMLRKWHLDELPQFFNVLAGNMSIVGPRPLLPEYFHLLTERHQKRYNVKPGMTGLVQISGGNSISWKRRFDLDVFYEERKSLGFDLWIIFQTIRYVVLGDNSRLNSEKFKGY